MGLAGLKNETFDLLIFYRDRAERLKGCKVQSFMVETNQNVKSGGLLGSREAYTIPTNTAIQFELKGVALEHNFECGRTERIEIVKRLEAYEDL